MMSCKCKAFVRDLNPGTMLVQIGIAVCMQRARSALLDRLRAFVRKALTFGPQQGFVAKPAA